MSRSYRVLFVLTGLLLAAIAMTFNHAFAHEASSGQKQLTGPTPDEIINAVNALRLAHGLRPLNPHPVLMQVAQTEADGIAAGMPGHWRPNNLTLGQWLLSLGYPLLGDLSMDGYRSENWGSAYTAQDAINMWLSDDIHTNTMLSENRSDIGAGVAVADDQIYVVLETAWQTNSGRMQYDAYSILTGIPLTVAAANPAIGTLSPDSLLVSQYSIPVKVSTARSNGDVYHEVKYGQALWSIAVEYHTKINQIQALNNLGTNTIVHPGDILLIQKGATQPAPPSATPNIVPAFASTSTAKPTGTLPPVTGTAVGESTTKGPSSGFGIGLLAFAVVVLVIVAASLIREPT